MKCDHKISHGEGCELWKMRPSRQKEAMRPYLHKPTQFTNILELRAADCGDDVF